MKSIDLKCSIRQESLLYTTRKHGQSGVQIFLLTPAWLNPRLSTIADKFLLSCLWGAILNRVMKTGVFVLEKALSTALTFRVSRSLFFFNNLFFNVSTQNMVLFFPAFVFILIPAYLPLHGSPLLAIFHSGPWFRRHLLTFNSPVEILPSGTWDLSICKNRVDYSLML